MIPQNITALERNMANAETLNTDFLNRWVGSIGSRALFSQIKEGHHHEPCKNEKTNQQRTGHGRIFNEG